MGIQEKGYHIGRYEQRVRNITNRLSNKIPVGNCRTSVFRKQLNGIGRYFLRCPNANLIVAAQIKGSITLDQLKSAVNELCGKHPLLRVRIDFDNNNNSAWITSEGVVEDLIYEVAGDEKDSQSWKERVNEEQRLRFDLENGPLIRFILLNYPGSLHLIINCHHSICDGISMTYLINDILSHVGDKRHEAHSAVPLALENTGPAPSIGFFKKIRLTVINWLWKSQRINFSDNDYRELHHKYWSTKKENGILSWELSEAQTTSFLDRCRRENVTVNSAVVTAFMAAQKCVQGERPSYLGAVSMPVDIRNRVRPNIGEVFGLFVSSVTTKLSYCFDVPFWNNVKKIQRLIKNNLTERSIFSLPQQTQRLQSTLLDSIYFIKYGLLRNRIASLFLRYSGVDRLNTGLEVSNIGRYSFPVEYGSLELEAIFVPCFLSDYQEKCLRVISVGKKMFFTLTFWTDIIDRITAEKIREISMAYISAATV